MRSTDGKQSIQTSQRDLSDDGLSYLRTGKHLFSWLVHLPNQELVSPFHLELGIGTFQKTLSPSTTISMSEVVGTAVCSHMIFGNRWSPEFSVLAPQTAGPARQSYPCLGHLCGQRRHALDTFVVRGGILQRISTWQRLGSILNTALELPLPRTHFVARGGIHQRISVLQRLG